MENITLGQVSLALTFIIGLISGIGFLSQNTKKWISNAMKEQMSDIKAQMGDITDRLDQVDLESTKNYLVTYLSDIERGKALDEIEKERFYEQYQHYLHLGGNSYIKSKVESLQKKGWL